MTVFALQLIELLSTPKTIPELLRITKVPDRTLRYNLAKLKKDGLIKEMIILSDLRKKMFLKIREVSLNDW